MQIVIDIPEATYEMIKEMQKRNGTEYMNELESGVAKGTPLPKGHGRLIDANSIYQIVRPLDPSDDQWGMTAYTAKKLVHKVFNLAPTIIEADTESEDKNENNAR